MRTKTKIIYVVIGMMFAFAISSIVLFYQLKNADQKIEKQVMLGKPWFDIPEHVSKKLLSRYAEVTTKGHVGSGCEIKPGFYLTALHVVDHAILDDSVIAVNGQKAQEVWRSKTDEDYIILTTWSEFEKGKMNFPHYNNFGDNTNVIAVGSPGDQRMLVQPAKIVKDAVDENNRAKSFSKIISTQYVDLGLSGGCIYSEDGETILGVITDMYTNPGSTIGGVTIVSRPTD